MSPITRHMGEKLTLVYEPLKPNRPVDWQPRAYVVVHPTTET